MRSLIINIARLHLCRLIWHRVHSLHSDQKCYDAFIEAMNTQNVQWGMNHTHWINPSGLGESGIYSQSTARDLAIMAINVLGILRTEKYHGSNGYEINIKKPYLIPNHRKKKKVIYSTIPYETIGAKYPIIGAKTGSGDGYQTLVMVCRIGEYMVSGAIMNAKDGNSRYDAMDELMRLGDKILHDMDISNCSVTNAKNACLYALSKGEKLRCIYTQNADELSAPMSVTKVMTLALTEKYKINLTNKVYITPFDTNGITDDILHEWDSLSIQDLINALMRCSSNVAANALARIIGDKIINTSKV